MDGQLFCGCQRRWTMFRDDLVQSLRKDSVGVGQKCLKHEKLI